jgi:hypothetical protein
MDNDLSPVHASCGDESIEQEGDQAPDEQRPGVVLFAETEKGKKEKKEEKEEEEEKEAEEEEEKEDE